ncbi:MAG: TIGR00341 family protein, partial [Candidatus Nitrosotalea sp.]|nr:TIGR00341 family protein [Candidatus Nitrosotalea sp.]
MEKIDVIVFQNQVDSVEHIIKDFNVPYIRINAKSDSDDCFLYAITIPDDMADEVIHKLSEVVDLTQKNVLINNIKTTSTLSNYLDKLADKIHTPKKIAIVIEELFPMTEPFTRVRKEIFVMLWIAAIVSMYGLFENSAATVIGAMLISPLLGPITALSLNATLGRVDKIKQSLIVIFLMLSTVIVLSLIITAIASQIVHLEITPQIQSRTNIHAIDIVISILLGVAGGLAMTSN